MIVTWTFTKKPNVRETGGFSGRSIISGAKRFERYWNVQFVQVSRNPNITFYLTDNMAPRDIARVYGTTIHVNSVFPWVFVDQQIVPMCHEIMHIYGGNNHLPPGNVMAAQAGNPYINFTQADSAYMSRFKWKSSLRPWNEPNFWVPPKKSALSSMLFGQKPIPEEWPILNLCGHENG